MSTREQIVLVRRSTNPLPHRQIITRANHFFDATQVIKGNRTALLTHARKLAMVYMCLKENNNG